MSTPRRRSFFPPIEDADRAITIVRDAIADIHVRVGKVSPDWLQEDDDKGWDRGSQTMAHMQVVHAGADPKGDETVRISYEYKDREFESDLCPAGTDPEPLADQLLQNLRIPVTAVRAYRGTTLIYERKVKMRGT